MREKLPVLPRFRNRSTKTMDRHPFVLRRYTAKEAAEMITSVETYPDEILKLRQKGVVQGFPLRSGKRTFWTFTKREINRLAKAIPIYRRE